MPRGGKRPGAGRPPLPETREPYAVHMLKAERKAMTQALDPGETLSAFLVTAGLEEARRRGER